MIRRVPFKQHRLLAALMLVVPGFAWQGGARNIALDGIPTSVKKVSCVFPTLATGTWTNGKPSAEIKSAKLSLKFESINTDEGTAEMVGAYGTADIIVRLSNGTLHLVQMFRDGPLYTTTVFPKETAGGKLQAVHTRHEYTEVVLPGFTSRPEQYYGECEIEP
jgi:hypothetical protein